MVKKKNFINNADLLEETKKSQEAGRMTEELGKMLLLMAQKYKKSRSGNFVNYTYFEDMVSAALCNLVKLSVFKFDTEKYSNAHAYYTLCIHRSFLQYLKKEKNHTRARDALLTKNGLPASYSYQEEMAAKLKEEMAEKGEHLDDEAIGHDDFIDIPETDLESERKIYFDTVDGD
jgi:DNA-directed RNA polymerase specialized sigma subunit